MSRIEASGSGPDEPPAAELVGPDHAGNLYEIGVVASTEGPVIVHAMPTRPNYLR